MEPVYNYFRDYDASIGRYVESDPIGLEGGVSTYGYADASAMIAADPLGLKAEICCRYLNSLLGAAPWRTGAVGLFQRHCFLWVDGTTYSLFPDGGIGRPDPGNEDDKRSKSKATTRCKPCKQKIADCESTADCLRKAHENYPIGTLSTIGWSER